MRCGRSHRFCGKLAPGPRGSTPKSANGPKHCSRRDVSTRSTRGFNLHARYYAGAVAELIALQTGLLKQREVQIRDRRTLRQHDVLADDLHFAVSAADHDVRLGIIVVQVA